MENSSINTSVEVKIGKKQRSKGKKKKQHKRNTEITPKKMKINREESAKKRTPPSAERLECK